MAIGLALIDGHDLKFFCVWASFSFFIMGRLYGPSELPGWPMHVTNG